VFYGTNGSDAIARAIDRAVEDGIDVVNMSLAIGDATTACDPTYDPSGISAHLRAALDAGVVFVASAGNETSGACTVAFPAFRPEVISIGALELIGAPCP
jgi:minor extracellular serine protease Vpr